jgi:hypothetical protein
MADYDIGYGKPPSATRFKPGTSGNPKGRPKRDQSLGRIVNDVLEAPVEYNENGRKRTATRREVTLKSLILRATQGDVGAAEILQRKRARALRRSDTGFKQLLIRDWLPDYPGQTATQKARELGSTIGAQVAAVEEVGPPERDGDLQQSSVREAVDEAP